MRRFGIMLLVLLAGTFTAIGQNGESSSEKKARAEITFSKKTHNFGKIPFKGDGSYTFKFENTGKKALIINDVQASCSCTASEWPEDPILPGKKGEITVEYDTRNPKNIGKFTKYIFIFNTATKNAIKLTITGILEKNKE